MNPYPVPDRRSALFCAVSRGCCLFLFVVLSLGLCPDQLSAQTPELTRTIRTWEFLPVVGTRAGLFGNETGQFEAWVYPLKIFRDFHLTFLVGDRALPAESLARTLTVRPESASILYVGDSFRVRETLCVPVNEAGAVILLDVETEQPLEVEAAFTGDFQLEWPAALGGTYVNWDDKQHAFVFGEEAKKFAALVGSPTGADARVAYQTNYSASDQNSMHLGVTQKGKETKVLVIAGSVSGQADAEKTYQHLLTSYADSMHEASAYYRAYLDKTVSLELPDADLQQAYDWARISTIQGIVNNPVPGNWLGCGIPDIRSRTAARLCMVLWPRFPLDLVCSQRRGRLLDYSHRARFHKQISTRRRQGSARDLAECESRSLVQGLSLRVRFRRCDATIHHRDE